MQVYNVCGSFPLGFYCQGYPTGRTSNTVESKRTKDRDQAERWCEAANRGEFLKEAGWASYADD